MERVETGALEVFDLWRETRALSFAAGEEQEAPRWLLELDEDPGAAERRLLALAEQARQARRRLDTVPGRLDALLRRGLPRPAEPSFSTAVSGGLPDAERNLLHWTAPTRGEVSFAAGERPDLGRLHDEIEDAIKRVTRLVTHVAWVETRAGGRLLGQTVVGWTGATRTLRSADATCEQTLLHQRNVTVALASRLGLLRMMVVVGQGAALLLSATSGVGAAAALPAVWRFVRQVLEEVKTRS